MMYKQSFPWRSLFQSCSVLLLLLGSSLIVFVSAQPPCSLCPDGSQPTNVDEPVEFGGEPQNCALLAIAASGLGAATTEACEGLRFGIAGPCGCNPLPPEERCQLCPPGTSLTSSDLLIEGSSCLEIEQQLSFLPPTSNLCQSLSPAFQLTCGCTPVATNGDNSTNTTIMVPAPERCTICPDGSPPPNASMVISPSGDEEESTTCGIANSIAQTLGIEDCDSFRFSLAGACGCAPRVENRCTLCPDGTPVPNRDMRLDFFDGDGEDDVLTCGALESRLAFISADEEICTQFVKAGGGAVASLCGCDVPLDNSTFQCPLCPDGQPPANPDAIVSFPGNEDPGNETLTCSQLEAFTRLATTGGLLGEGGEQAPEGFFDLLCETMRFGASSSCGCTPPATPEFCSLCPDGRPPTLPDLVFDDEDATSGNCGELASNVQFVSADFPLCTNSSGFFAGFCGCEGLEVTCPLCEDGSSPMEPDLLIGDQTCGTWERIVSVLPGPLCSSQQAVTGVYCGCNNTIASAGACRICQGITEGNLLPEPNRLVNATLFVGGDVEEIACGALELEVNDDGGEGACSGLQSRYAAECCALPPTMAPVTMAPTTPSPTAGPTANVTTSTTAAPEPTNATEPATTPQPTPVIVTGRGTNGTAPPAPSPTSAATLSLRGYGTLLQIVFGFIIITLV